MEQPTVDQRRLVARQLRAIEDQCRRLRLSLEQGATLPCSDAAASNAIVGAAGYLRTLTDKPRVQRSRSPEAIAARQFFGI